MVKRTLFLVTLNYPMPISMFMSSLSLQFAFVGVRFTQGCDGDDGVIVRQVFAMRAAHLSAACASLDRLVGHRMRSSALCRPES